MQPARCAVFTFLLLAMATPALADATVFIGTATSPSNRMARGFAVGAGFLIVGFEFEYSDTAEEPEDGAPSVRTYMGNVLLQTPWLGGVQLYLTTGAGGYYERLGDRAQADVGLNSGGGAKIRLLGPVRARIDYRVFNLRDSRVDETVQRLYGGVNFGF